MSRNLLIVILSAAFASLLQGCIVSQTVNLQNLDVTGPRNHPPVHLQTDSASTRVTVSPRFDFNAGPAITGTLPDQENTNTSAKIRWKMPDVTGSLDADLPVTPAIAFSLGGTVADELWGAHAGMGIRFWGKGLAGRLEAGVQWQSLSSHATYVLTNQYSFSSSSDSVLIDRHVRQSHANWYGALTLNSHFPDAGFNLFVQVALVNQTLFSVHILNPGETDAEYNSSYVVLTPGLSLNFGPSTRLLLGARMDFENRIEGVRADPKIMPFLQMDFEL